NGNAYHRTSPKNPERFACWANGKKGTESFPTLTTFRNATGQDPQSTLTEGAAITDGLGRLIASLATVPRALPAKIAQATGQATGVKKIGGFSKPLP
ncbi:right-handed parallel beta-helix repeat-containing protein, partial [Aeromicrobium sp. zg-636]